MIINAMPY